MIRSEISEGLAVLRLDAPPVNALSLELLDALVNAVRAAVSDPAVQAIVITGSAESFSAGVDIPLLQRLAHGDDARAISRRFQEAFQEIEDSPKPVAAALAGMVLGGALELALACHIRVADRAARFGLPEVTLAIVPGAGGTQRLPRVVGPEAALRMLLTGQTVRADEALAVGLIDAACESQALLARCQELALAGGPVVRTRLRTDRLDDRSAVEAALAQGEATADKARPELVAPRRIVRTVRTGLETSFEAGIEAEREALAECIATPAARHRIDLFLAQRQTGKLPEVVGVLPTVVQTAAVVGLGTMGTGIAQALLQSGFRVLVFDQDPAAAQRAVARLREAIEKRGGASTSAVEQIVPVADWGGLDRADLVIESVYEDQAVKRSVLQRLEQVCPAGAVLATNTSTLSIDGLSQGLHHPERLVGMHFFNPAHRMPLVEVIRGEATAPAILAGMLAVCKSLRKTPVVVRNREGFIVTRLFVPYVQEAFALLSEGVPPEKIDEAMVLFGFPMGPLTLIDMAGIDILLHSHRVLLEAFPRHEAMPAVVERLVGGGQLGQKTGGGVYRYQPGDRTPHANPELPALAGLEAFSRVEVHPGAIAERLVLRMVAEALFIVEDGIVRSPADVDVATVLGIGFPDFRGGVLAYADDLGRDHLRQRLTHLHHHCGPRFASP